MVLDFFSSGYLPKNLNMTWVILIPKFDGTKDMKDFRPISMVGCIYKMISKILARRLKSVMNGLVEENKSAFIQRRQILDGALIGCEIVHWLKKIKETRSDGKTNFKKVYDLVHWSFVDHVFEEISFGEIWRRWIRGCLSTAAVSILVNGFPSSN